MAFKGVLSVVFVCLFGLGSATYCTSDYSCSSWQECCSNNRCQDSCSSSRYSCSYDYQCSTGKECCNGKCSSACTYWGAIAGSVIGTIVFFAISISIVSCYCCSCCPYYHYRRSRNVVAVAQQPGGGQAVMSTVSTTVQSPGQQQMQQYPPPGNYPPPPGNYNQPPPGNYNQPPPEYPASYSQNPAPQRQAQVSMPPTFSAGQPGKH